jgi:hypothetical protein
MPLHKMTTDGLRGVKASNYLFSKLPNQYLPHSADVRGGVGMFDTFP